MGKKFKNKDIAAKLGVSGTLVSLVLNNKADQHGIKKETREKVLALARQMGFFSSLPEKSAPLPVETTPGIIGMVVASLDDPLVAGITPYLRKAFSSIGMGFSIVTKDADDQRFDRMIGACKKFFTGLILVGDAADDTTIRTLRSTDYPFVALEKPQKTAQLNSVCTDVSAGVRLVADHISKLGYKNAAIITEKKSFRNDIPLIEELEKALEKIPGSNKPVVLELEKYTSQDDVDFGQLETFLRPPYRAEIIIALHSSLVYPVMGLFRKKKLRVPQDIALMSMEEGAGFEFMQSPVTCLRKPFPGMAIKVANMLWSEIKNSGKGKFKRQVNIVQELEVGGSCGTA